MCPCVQIDLSNIGLQAHSHKLEKLDTELISLYMSKLFTMSCPSVVLLGQHKKQLATNHFSEFWR